MQVPLAAPLDDLEKIKNPCSAVVAPQSSDRINRPTGRAGNTLNREELMTHFLDEKHSQEDSDWECMREQQRTSEPVLNDLVERAQVLEVTEDADNQLTDMLKTRVTRVTEDSLVSVVETINNDRIKSLIWQAFRRVTLNLMTAMLEDNGVCKASEFAIIRLVTRAQMIQATAKMTVKVDMLMESVDTFVADQSKKGVNEAAQQSKLSAPPSPPLEPSDPLPLKKMETPVTLELMPI